jgi:hypothetical protein
MKTANKVLLDFSNNPELRAALSTYKVGQKLKLEVELQIDSFTEEGLEGSVKSIAPEGYEAPPGATNEGEGEIKPKVNEPVMMMVKQR